MMRIVHVINGLGDGGAEKSLVKLVISDDINVHSVISLTTIGKYGLRLSDAGIHVVLIGWNSWNAVPALARLHRAVRAMKPDVIHGWMPHGSLAASVMAGFAPNMRVVWSIRASEYGKGKGTLFTRVIVRTLALLSHSVPSKILMVGEVAREKHAKIGFPRDKMICIQNGYESASTPILGQEKNETLSLKPERNQSITVFGMVARWHPKKDHQGLLEALALLNRTRTDWTVRLVGEGVSDHNQKLVDIVASLGLKEQVRLLGPLLDPGEFYKSLDFHILSSSYGEGFPNVVAESMLAGVPNIVTDVGDSAFIVGDAGWIARPADPDSLRRAIEAALICETSERRAKAARAKKRILEEFPLERMVQSHLRQYEG